MPNNEFNADEALRSILGRLRAKENAGVQRLADEIETIIDQGTLDKVDQSIELNGLRRTKKVSKARSLTDREALGVAVNLLRTYFLELPMILSSVEDEFVQAANEAEFQLGYDAKIELDVGSIGKAKRIQIELVTETTRFKDGRDLVDLPHVSDESLRSQANNFSLLRQLLDLGN